MTKLIRILCAAALCLTMAGSAMAATSIGNFKLDLSQFGAAFPLVEGIEQMQFEARTRTWTSNATGTLASVGDTSIIQGIGRITAYLGDSIPPQAGPAGNINGLVGTAGAYELTFTFTNKIVITATGFDIFGNYVTAFNHSNNDSSFTQSLWFDDRSGLADGTLESTFDAAGFANGSFTDGTLISTAGALPMDIGTTTFDPTDLSQAAGGDEAAYAFTFLRDLTWLYEDGTPFEAPYPDDFYLDIVDSNFDTDGPGVAFADFDALFGADAPEAGMFEGLVFVQDGSIDLAVVPEPATMILAGMGLLGFGIRSRRRK